MLYNIFNPYQDQTPAPNPYPQVTPGAPGAIGSTGGPGKGGGIFGIGDENVQTQLAASGYSPYTATAAPDVAGLFTTDQRPEQQFRQGELGLMQTLQGASTGQGPDAGLGILAGATDQNVAQQMALAASGRGAPGTMAGAQTAGAMAQQEAARQAAVLRAQEEATARGQLGTVTAQGMGADLGEQQIKATQGAGLAGLDEGQWQYLNSLNAGQKGALNAIIAQAVAGANASQQALLPQAIGALGGAGSAAITGGMSLLTPKPAATGAVATSPQIRLIGEAGPEAVVPIHNDGSPDMARATDPRLRWILENHGQVGAEARASGMPTALPQADHGILGQIVALRHDIQNLMRGGR